MRVSSVYRALCALIASSLILSLSPAALAGTTGSLSGTIVDASTRAPIAGVQVSATSASQVAHVTTDAGRQVYVHLARAGHIHDLGAADRIRSAFGRGNFRIRGSESVDSACAAKDAQRNRARHDALVDQSGPFGHGDRRLLSQPINDDRGRSARRRRIAE